jgi:hypothetical protein
MNVDLRPERRFRGQTRQRSLGKSRNSAGSRRMTGLGMTSGEGTRERVIVKHNDSVSGFQREVRSKALGI